MTRANSVPAARRRRKKILKQAKGQFGGRSKLFKTARESVQKGMAYATRDRKARKREFRALWIARITAACNEKGLSYSKFMGMLKKEKIDLDRKILSDLAIRDKNAFGMLIALAKK